MALSGGSIETLIQLLEAKLGTVEVFDREDAREVKVLQRCREELAACRGKGTARTKASSRAKNRSPNAPASPL